MKSSNQSSVTGNEDFVSALPAFDDDSLLVKARQQRIEGILTAFETTDSNDPQAPLVVNDFKYEVGRCVKSNYQVLWPSLKNNYQLLQVVD